MSRAGALVTPVRQSIVVRAPQRRTFDTYVTGWALILRRLAAAPRLTESPGRQT